jgi:outer membrane murein-binding lipoprotein Lpp
MKKFLMVLVAATLALSITGCKKETKADEAANTIEEATNAATDAVDGAKKAVEE